MSNIECNSQPNMLAGFAFETRHFSNVIHGLKEVIVWILASETKLFIPLRFILDFSRMFWIG